MRHLLNTLFITSEDIYLSLDGENVVANREGQAVAFGKAKEVITPQALEAVYGMEMDVLTVHDRYGAERTICLPVKKP